MKYFYILALSVLIITLSGRVGLAVEQVNATSARDIAFHFHRLSDTLPPLEQWVMQENEYIAASKFDKDLVMDRLLRQFVQDYDRFDNDGMVTVKTTVDLSSLSALQNALFIEKFMQDGMYLYTMRGHQYALIVDDLDQFGAIALSDHEMEVIRAQYPGGQGEMAVELTVQPLSADGKDQITIDKKRYWPMIGRTAELRLWTMTSNNATQLLVKRADWYRPTNDLDTLFVE